MKKFLQSTIAAVACLALLTPTLTAARATPEPRQTKEQPLRVGGNVKSPKQTKYVAPEYSDDVLKRHPKGIIALELILDATGKVDAVKRMKGHAEIAEFAIAAARQWEFAPTVVDGKAAWLSLTVLVPFPNPAKAGVAAAVDR